ncbi:MAG: hypothetical protein Q7O66_01230 [Dehalococcoidia bacterium]|nr:hypothetical protein [Dehalococcoidia bacterium]
MQKDQTSGISFVFKRDSADPKLLYIYVRHLTDPEDAIQTFFAAESVRKEQHRRFESYSATHGLFWFRLEPLKAAMVTSCFKLEASE